MIAIEPQQRLCKQHRPCCASPANATIKLILNAGVKDKLLQ
jgi:hypothetical protein